MGLTAGMGDAFEQVRTRWQAEGLVDDLLADDPFEQFRRWMDQCLEVGLHEPEAMVVASVGADGMPSARHVLLKELDHGFVFFTNYESRKGHELDGHPKAAVCFPWNLVSRQVRAVGGVERVTVEESDAYFATRPRSAQIGAWASRQSEAIDDRATLEAWVAEAEACFDGIDVPRPPHWGGYRIVPVEFEFWQGRPARLHDRIRYEPAADGWRRERLSP
ncbi:pyridoxamine 5'-phosphate oxidase [Rhabdothermincola salaria]|uniref:pyridoxamine 5'-phosphate oxidase n=1 Tax=Rhabdothermincola salaria TaxID=2903142 RepID=UPI001E2AE73B|nr:pyridoxamine 5'-phosphate oxidase [Rhabdothermincola salaria]MCD9624589.1 pyridoxamine 5'-phosphate oxidase [Rhabdothermincola salaria]